MSFRTVSSDNSLDYNAIVSHPLQSFEWGEFREKTGVQVIRRGKFDGDKLIDGFTLTIHGVPHTKLTIGYLPKGKMPDEETLEELRKIGKENNCIFIQLEPNIVRSMNDEVENKNIEEFDSIIHNSNFIIQPSAHPLFTKYTFILDLDTSEDELLQHMHSKTRYNIKVANKHGVVVKEDNSDEAFKEYIALTEETTKRQGFYAHSRKYHETQWSIFHHTSLPNTSRLTSHLFTGSYEGKVLTALLFFIFKDTLYYPYGASSNEHRNTMHSTLTMWEGIRFGKNLGLKNLDMWGAADEENPDTTNPYYGFHRFKQGFGASYTEFLGSYDLVINPGMYQVYKIADKLRWAYLRLRK
jgi:lipid II:glycine glycyltransferase (peptidoglycan interpeptide bridge formation enzyme)